MQGTQNSITAPLTGAPVSGAHFNAGPVMSGAPMNSNLLSQKQNSIFTPGSKRRRLNIVGVCLNIFFPWFVFCLIYGLMSFSFHYKHPVWAWLFVALGYVLTVVLAVLAYRARRRHRDPMWYTFAAVAFFVATTSATVCGDLNFWYNMQPYYDIENLNSYPDVNVYETPGQSLMDAGEVFFAAGTRLDKTKAIGFKNLDTYCVAPIVDENHQDPPQYYDFWAVGINCCRGSSADFECGEHANTKARSGLRLMRDDQRPFFRLAVQQAEAHHKIRSAHPLFFYWMQDPVAEINTYADDGFKYFLIGIFTHFAANLLLVIVAMLCFSKIGQYT